jgi:hypothetical protein
MEDFFTLLNSKESLEGLAIKVKLYFDIPVTGSSTKQGAKIMLQYSALAICLLSLNLTLNPSCSKPS